MDPSRPTAEVYLVSRAIQGPERYDLWSRLLLDLCAGLGEGESGVPFVPHNHTRQQGSAFKKLIGCHPRPAKQSNPRALQCVPLHNPPRMCRLSRCISCPSCMRPDRTAGASIRRRRLGDKSSLNHCHSSKKSSSSAATPYRILYAPIPNAG